MRPFDLPSIAKLAASKSHGTRLRYMSGCHCMLCRAANSRYECMRAAARQAGDWNGLVSAGPARRHIILLAASGVGRDSIAAACDVGVTTITEIRARQKLRIRARTARKILSVTTAARGGACLVNAGPTWRRIKRLLREGFTKGGLALRIGNRTRNLQIRKSLVLARTAMKIERLYRTVMAG
jgi:hypothetical protein